MRRDSTALVLVLVSGLRWEIMIRSLFLAVGLYCFLLGLECLVIDKAVLAATSQSAGQAVASQVVPSLREFTPADWAPWSLMSGGAVVMLYTITLPKKVA